MLHAAAVTPAYLGTIDCVQIDAYTDDEAIGVLRSGGRVQQLVDASPVLRGLSRERFVHHRANQLGHGRVMHAAPQHGTDRGDEGDEDEQQQWHHEQKGGDALLATGAGGLAGFAGGQG